MFSVFTQIFILACEKGKKISLLRHFAFTLLRSRGGRRNKNLKRYFLLSLEQPLFYYLADSGVRQYRPS